MGLLSLLGFGPKKVDRLLVVVTMEAAGRFRLNGNRVAGERGRQGAAAHDQTVGWIEFDPDGGRLGQGLGPAASRLPAADVQRLMADLPTDPACLALLKDLAGGRDRASKVLRSGPAAAD